MRSPMMGLEGGEGKLRLGLARRRRVATYFLSYFRMLQYCTIHRLVTTAGGSYSDLHDLQDQSIEQDASKPLSTTSYYQNLQDSLQFLIIASLDHLGPVRITVRSRDLLAIE